MASMLHHILHSAPESAPHYLDGAPRCKLHNRISTELKNNKRRTVWNERWNLKCRLVIKKRNLLLGAKLKIRMLLHYNILSLHTLNLETIMLYWDLRFSWRWGWCFSGFWRHVDSQVDVKVSMKYTVSIFVATVLSLHTLKFEIRTLYCSIATFFTAVKSVNVIYSVCTATSCLSIKIMRHDRRTWKFNSILMLNVM
jgi:hypothetical protein